MNANSQFGRLLLDLWGDLQQAGVLWQVGVLACCLALGGLAGHLVRNRQVADGTVAWQIGQRGLKRRAFPLTALVLVLLARPVLAHWHRVNLLSLAVPLLASLAVIRAAFFALRQTFSGPWLASFERGFAFLVWGVVALYLAGLLPDLIAFLESVQFTVGKQPLNLWLIFQGVATVLGMLLVALWIGGAIEARLLAVPGLDSNLRAVFSRLARAGLILLAVLIGLPLVGIDLTTLSVFGGALGVGLGLGLQRIASNYVSGFIILLDRSIRIGNVINVDRFRGEVREITTRYTVLRSTTGIESIVPNEMLISAVVENETFSNSRVRVALAVQVSYHSDLDLAMRILTGCADAHPRVLDDPAPQAFVTGFADSGINLELGLWIADPQEGTLAVRSAINLEIWREFKRQGIEIPFPQREIRLLPGATAEQGGTTGSLA